MAGLWLGIETTGATGGIALVRDGETVAEEYFPVMATHSEKLLPGIAGMLDSYGLGGGDIAGIAVSAGPGSYTGLRIGMSTAQGLSTGWGKGVVAVMTLRVLSCSIKEEGPVMPCIRARRGEVFAAVYTDSSPGSASLVDPGVYTVEALTGLISGMGVLTAVGSGTEIMELPGSVLRVVDASQAPSPSVTAVLGAWTASRSGFHRHPVPFYLRDFNQRAVSSVP